MKKLNIVVFGLSITSSWGNGHATTFRSLLKALARRGHRVLFFEKDQPWYAANRDLPSPPFCRTVLYQSIDDLWSYECAIAQADLIILGSFVEDGPLLARRIYALAPACFAFYDIDTPVTVAKMAAGDCDYLLPQMIPGFDLYLSFSGGPILDTLEGDFGAQCAVPLYCSVDPDLYFPEAAPDLYFPGIDSDVGAPDPTARPEQRADGNPAYTLGYLGTYSEDRQPALHELLIEPARQLSDHCFCVAGAQYPNLIQWPANVETVDHIPPHQHRRFYNAQRFTLNITRHDMIHAGYAPSVRLFEAGACGTPVISDYWEGLESLFTPGEDILIANNRGEVLDYLHMSDDDRLAIGLRFRAKVLAAHTAEHRAMEVEYYWQQITLSELAESLHHPSTDACEKTGPTTNVRQTNHHTDPGTRSLVS